MNDELAYHSTLPTSAIASIGVEKAPAVRAHRQEPYEIEIVDSLARVSAHEWNALQPSLFVRHEFLHALEASGCVGERTGWLPQHLTLRRAGVLQAACPLYLKFHSYGEYVFDWAWADAYERAGQPYYPKLLCAVPFTPIACEKLLAADDAARAALAAALTAHAREQALPSLHCLFLPPRDAALLDAQQLMPRSGVQYHWRNRGYANFDEFLAQFSHDKRKKIKQERRKVREQGVRIRWLVGAEIGAEEWTFFLQCYRRTYREHHSSPYLNLDFFHALGERLGAHTLLIVAYVGEQAVASALCLFDAERLYGRYWGSIGQLSHLHFELCYYQAIEFAIARGLQVFEGGAQGEHKIARGLLPVETHSAHWVAQPAFGSAIENFLARERKKIAQYIQAWEQDSPLKPYQDTEALDEPSA